MRYKHKILLEIEVETSHKDKPLHSEIAQALFQKRKDENLVGEIKILSTEEIEDRKKFIFYPPIRFGGHKVAHGVTIPLPIDLDSITVMDLHYTNEGTDQEQFEHFRRRVYDKEPSPGGNKRFLNFKFEQTNFKVLVDEDYIIQYQTMTCISNK